MPRKGFIRRYVGRGWFYRQLGYGHGARDYDEYLARERARIRALPSVSIADCKRSGIQRVRPGDYFRCMDGHGRSYGKRFTAPHDMPSRSRVRLVNRQPEDYHSLVSRMSSMLAQYPRGW